MSIASNEPGRTNGSPGLQIIKRKPFDRAPKKKVSRKRPTRPFTAEEIERVARLLCLQFGLDADALACLRYHPALKYPSVKYTPKGEVQIRNAEEPPWAPLWTYWKETAEMALDVVTP